MLTSGAVEELDATGLEDITSDDGCILDAGRALDEPASEPSGHPDDVQGSTEQQPLKPVEHV